MDLGAVVMSATRNVARLVAPLFHNAALQRENTMWFYLLDLAVFFHWAFMGKSSERRPRRVVLNAENVEDRCVPSATSLGVEPIVVSAIPVDQFAQARVMQDAASSIPVEQIDIAEKVESTPDDRGSIYGFNPQPDPPGVGIMEWSWGESSTNPGNDGLMLACSNNLRPGSDELLIER